MDASSRERPSRTPSSREAGCGAHKSGFVRGAPAEAGAPTRHQGEHAGTMRNPRAPDLRDRDRDRSRNPITITITKFDHEIRSRNSITKFDHEIRSRNSITKFDHEIRSR